MKKISYLGLNIKFIDDLVHDTCHDGIAYVLAGEGEKKTFIPLDLDSLMLGKS